MRTHDLHSAIAGAGALMVLAGCSGSGSLSPTSSRSGAGASVASSLRGASTRIPSVARLGVPPRRSGSVAPKAFVDAAAVAATGGNQIIVSDFNNSAIDVYGAGGKRNATITSVLNPQGLATDPSGTLYVANTGASDILLFPKPYKNVGATLADPKYYPVDVAVDANGNVAATNIIAVSGSAGNVVFYAKGATTPCATVSDAKWANVYFAAFDKTGNLYVDGRDVNGSTLIGVIAGGCKATSIATLSTVNAIGFPGGIAVLASGNIAIDDQTAGNISTYAPPSGGSLGSPVATTTLAGARDVVTFKMKAFDRNIWASDAAASLTSKFAYPGGGSAIKSVAGGSGVAVNPAQPL